MTLYDVSNLICALLVGLILGWTLALTIFPPPAPAKRPPTKEVRP